MYNYLPILLAFIVPFLEWRSVGAFYMFIHFDVLAKSLQLRSSSAAEKVYIKDADSRSNIIVWKRFAIEDVNIKGNPSQPWQCSTAEAESCINATTQEWTLHMNATGT